MNSYKKFAAIYDRLIRADIDYDKIADFIEKNISSKALKTPKEALVLDLACGSGILTEKLKNKGYDMIGIDLSEDMLSIAKKRNPDILYLCQDMREFELYGTVDCICCMTDAINYVTKKEDLLTVFKLAKNYLNPNSPFIFDMNSEYKIETVLGNNTFTYEDDEVFYVWENEFDKESRICDFYLTFFVRKEDDGGDKKSTVYERFDEQHSERAYGKKEVVSLLKEAGFLNTAIFGGYGEERAFEESERLVFVAF